jgi:predicted nucleic acid-binding protein
LWVKSRVLTFTLESNAVSGDAWGEDVAKLIEFSRAHPKLLHLARTTGALREASAGHDRQAAARRQTLMEGVPEIVETALSGISRYGEAVFAGPDDQRDLDAIHAALWPDKARPDPSEANDALHLATHLKHDRDYFVTIDTRMLKASDKLQMLGIRVVDPGQALVLARTLQPKVENT